ncbi:MAG TPA: pantoate--beta-alanine ligase [Candidatus Dormibacteraeota bacterium]
MPSTRTGLLRLASPPEARRQAEAWRAEGLSVGLVPTMGALHRGHLSLVERARRENDRVIVSVFVNPLQFGPGEDFERYPRDLEADLHQLDQPGADAVYTPSVEAMYPPDATTRVQVGAVGQPLEGEFRPGHFEGVATVVLKLFNACRPHRAYFGQKDAQQVAVVGRMARDLDTGVEIVACPTVREPDGLALSSRNAYLSTEERAAATVLSRALRQAAQAWADGERDPGRLRAAMHEVLREEPLARPDYAEVVDPATFRPGLPLAVLAVRVGSTRLIDNHDLSVPFPRVQ